MIKSWMKYFSRTPHYKHQVRWTNLPNVNKLSQTWSCIPKIQAELAVVYNLQYLSYADLAEFVIFYNASSLHCCVAEQNFCYWPFSSILGSGISKRGSGSDCLPTPPTPSKLANSYSGGRSYLPLLSNECKRTKLRTQIYNIIMLLAATFLSLFMLTAHFCNSKHSFCWWMCLLLLPYQTDRQNKGL